MNDPRTRLEMALDVEGLRVVLSIVRPDGTATVLSMPRRPTGALAAMRRILKAPPINLVEPKLSQTVYEYARSGSLEWLHQPSGYMFRTDPASNPPNVCPCCHGLVRPGDHQAAGLEDAYCLGCFTWQRDVPKCLPENSAHPVGYDPDKEN